MSNPIPKDKSIDAAISMLMEGYEFISNRCKRYNTDIFEIRFMFQKTVCMMGKEAAEVFYNNEYFKREGALPKRGLKSFLGEDGVQVLDDAQHRNRKGMFMSLMSPERIKDLVNTFSKIWILYLDEWEEKKKIELLYESSEILCRAVFNWCGVPLDENEVKERTYNYLAMIDSPTALGLRHWKGRSARNDEEKLISDIIEKIRNKEIIPPDNSAAYVIANFKTMDGNLLDKKTAAVEVINIIRPTIAIGRFITFAAHALFNYPGRNKILDDENYAEYFVHEVRRFYPFFPVLAAIVKDDFEWRGYHFKKGMRVILDLYATNHDSRIWEEPDVFNPDRFKRWRGDHFGFIPQGGGDYYINHRCPGEWITIEIMKIAVEVLTKRMVYKVPHQDLDISLKRIPAEPKSRFIIEHVRKV